VTTLAHQAESGVGRLSGHARIRTQITRFGATRGGHAGDEVAVQLDDMHRRVGVSV